jgi:hypothetical protein
MCKPSQAGDELFTTNYTIFGELKHTGPIMVSTNFRTQDLTYVALTAGHVIPEYQDTMFVRNKLDNTFIPLKVSERSKRLKAKLPIKLSRRIILVSRRLRATELDINDADQVTVEQLLARDADRVDVANGRVCRSKKYSRATIQNIAAVQRSWNR